MELSARYIGDRKLPDKAIDVIDEVGAAQMLVPEKRRRKKTINVKDIEAISLQDRAYPGPSSVSRDDKDVLRTLDDVEDLVFGQDKAIEACPARSSWPAPVLRDPEKPIGSYLFSGPTGVGKTEVARQLVAHAGHRSSHASTCRNIWSVIPSAA